MYNLNSGNIRRKRKKKRAWWDWDKSNKVIVKLWKTDAGEENIFFYSDKLDGASRKFDAAKW